MSALEAYLLGFLVAFIVSAMFYAINWIAPPYLSWRRAFSPGNLSICFMFALGSWLTAAAGGVILLIVLCGFAAEAFVEYLKRKNMWESW